MKSLEQIVRDNTKRPVGRPRGSVRRRDGRESISVDVETYEKIKRLAELRGESMSQVVETITACLEVKETP